VVERLAVSDNPAGLDRTQEAVVMFVDIIGFTGLSEGMPPVDAMALLRAFHTRVERAVFDAGGMVDKFMGDGAMACFGTPDPSPTAAADAIHAALALLADLATVREPALQVGIGVHLGPVLMGDIGGATQFQFTVIGDTVNVASRLESLTRLHATRLILSDPVLASARPLLAPELLHRFEPLHGLEIRGRDGTLDAWRLTMT
jgi:adenylate cyclase